MAPLTGRKFKEYLGCYLMIAPVVLGLVWLYVIPFFQSIVFSFMDIDIFGKKEFIGFDNYLTLFEDETIQNTFGNSFFYVLVAVPGGIVTGLFLAHLLNNKIRWKECYKTLYFLPVVTMPAAVGLIGSVIFSSEFGVVNSVISTWGGEPVKWLTSPGVVKYTISIVLIWQMTGYNMILFLANLQSVPKEYYEAAEIDGVSGLKKFITISMPLISPTIFFVLVIQIINTFQIFDIIFIMIPELNSAYESAASIGVYYYNLAFRLDEKGSATALAFLLFIVIMVFTYFQFQIQKKWVYYEKE